jgi:hypothetical protein
MPNHTGTELVFHVRRESFDRQARITMPTGVFMFLNTITEAITYIDHVVQQHLLHDEPVSLVRVIVEPTADYEETFFRVYGVVDLFDMAGRDYAVLFAGTPDSAPEEEEGKIPFVITLLTED